MRILNLVLLTLALLSALCGCKEPEPVQVIPPSDTSGLEISAIAVPDTAAGAVAVDSGAVLPLERARFSGFLTLTRLTYDNGQVISGGAFSQVLFEDTSQAVRFLGRTFGFHGIDLGMVALDSIPMLSIPHRVRIFNPLLDTSVIRGVEYVLDFSGRYQPLHPYAWTAPAPDSLSPFGLEIMTPENVTVLSPRGGTVIARDQDLLLRWTGRGNLSIIVSGVNVVTQKTFPLLHIRPRVNTGMLIVPSKFLGLLPIARFRQYALSFVLANRNETSVVGGFQGRILVQAASVYTTFVDLR